MLKAVIVDLDGTLVDSTLLQQEAMRLFIESFGKIYLPPKGSREGMRIIDIIDDYKDIFDLPGSTADLYKKRQEIYFGLVTKKLQLFPDVFLLLEKFKKKNLRIVLATSGDREYVRRVWRKFPELGNYFTLVVTGDDVVRGKPYPDIYQKALDELNIKSQEAVVIEDSTNGVLAAKAAKIKVVCVPNKQYPDADYTQADALFPSLKVVANMIVV